MLSGYIWIIQMPNSALSTSALFLRVWDPAADLQSRIPRKGAPDHARTIDLPRLLPSGPFWLSACQLQRPALLCPPGPRIEPHREQGVQHIHHLDAVEYCATTHHAKAVLLRNHVHASISGLWFFFWFLYIQSDFFLNLLAWVFKCKTYKKSKLLWIKHRSSKIWKSYLNFNFQ